MPRQALSETGDETVNITEGKSHPSASDRRKVSSSSSALYPTVSQYGSTGHSKKNPSRGSSIDRSFSTTNMDLVIPKSPLEDSERARYHSVREPDKWYDGGPRHGYRRAFSQSPTGAVPKMIAPPYLLMSASDLRDSDEAKNVQKNGQTVPPPPLTGRQKLTIVMLAFANFCATTLFSMIAPFFPGEAAVKGASPGEVGLIFGVFQLCIFIASPIFGRCMAHIGPKFLYTAGLFIAGVSSILFGLLNLSPPGGTFVGLCFAVRCIEAIGDAMFMTASFTIIANEFKGRVATIIGLLETFSGLGFMVGPPIGGALYQLGGFGLPFFLAGVLLLLATLLAFPLVPAQGQALTEHGGYYLRLLRMPSVILMSFAVVISAISLGFMDPTLQPHLAQFNLNSLLVGLMFMLIAGVYTLLAPFVGWFLDRKGHGKEVVACGTVVMVIGFLLIGPSPIFGVKPQLWIIAIGMLCIGLGISGQFIPSFNECLSAAKSKGIPDDLRLFGNISGLFQASMSFGAFLGPTIGGQLVQAIGFEWSSSIYAGLHLILLIITTCFIIVDRCLIKRRENRALLNPPNEPGTRDISFSSWN